MGSFLLKITNYGRDVEEMNLTTVIAQVAVAHTHPVIELGGEGVGVGVEQTQAGEGEAEAKEPRGILLNGLGIRLHPVLAMWLPLLRRILAQIPRVTPNQRSCHLKDPTWTTNLPHS